MKIELIPALDIIDGQCVRLTKGDYDQKTVYRDAPAEVASEFEAIGFRRLHVVDLDGAKSKHIVNSVVLSSITAETALTVDFGGGIKTNEDIETAFAAGAAMVTVGSVAVTQPELFMGWLDKYGADRMILGADVRQGMISINGWKEDSSEGLLPFLKKYVDAGVKNVLCTEISKDGTLAGPAIDLYKQVAMRILGLRTRRHIYRKEVVIEDPKYAMDVSLLQNINEEISQYNHKHKLLYWPNPVKVFFRGDDDQQIEKINNILEMAIEDLGYSTDTRILAELNHYPVIATHAHTRPFRRRWMNILTGLVLPVGIFFYFRMIRFRLRLYQDLRTIRQTSERIIPRATELAKTQGDPLQDMT